MTMKVILYTDTDGNLCIVSVTSEMAVYLTDEQVAQASVPAGVPYVIVDESHVPPDRTFRNAWEYDTTTNPAGIGAPDGTIIATFTVDSLKLVKGEGFVQL